MRSIWHPAALVMAATTAVLFGPLAGAASAQPAAPCGNAADACIDLSGNRAWLMDDGAVTYGPVPVSHGKPGYETPPGVFTVSFKNKDHHSSIYDAPMPYAVFFNGGIAFHEGDLTSQSGGCVRLTHEAAKTFFSDLDPSDVVEVVP